jgi:hypothetical protein
VDNIYNPLAVFEFKEIVYIAVCSKEKIRLVVIGVSLIVENSIKEIQYQREYKEGRERKRFRVALYQIRPFYPFLELYRYSIVVNKLF